MLKDNMNYLPEIALVLAPWLAFIIIALCAGKLIKSARKGRSYAVALAVFVQMVLPDPQIEKTIQTIVVEKRKLEQNENGEDKDKDKEQ